MTTETLPIESRERTASDVLLAAARYIEEHGWFSMTTGRRGGGELGHCASNTICQVAEGEPRWAAQNRLIAHLNGSPFDGAMWIIWDWNDAPGRTREEVLAALREAAR